MRACVRGKVSIHDTEVFFLLFLGVKIVSFFFTQTWREENLEEGGELVSFSVLDQRDQTEREHARGWIRSMNGWDKGGMTVILESEERERKK